MAGYGVLLATTISFLLAEIGDKTQIATATIAAEYHRLWQLIGDGQRHVAGRRAGLWLGARFAQRLPLQAARIGAALLFAGLALWILLK